VLLLGQNDIYYNNKNRRIEKWIVVKFYIVKVKMTSGGRLRTRYELYWVELSPGLVVWCPFDKEDSEFVKIFKGAGFKVICSHIETGQDFFNYEPAEHWDIIISNPPFSGKREIFERAMSFNKPFALLMSNTWLNDAAPKQVLGNEMELLMFEERINFIDSDGEVCKKGVTFSSSYYCRGVLDRAIICDSLKNYMK
jgi:hypothetical protein